MSPAYTLRAADSESTAGPNSACAYARELRIAVPKKISDLYLLHQEVWGQINASRDDRLCLPEILYRRDGGCVSVRVGAAAMRHGAPSAFCARTGEIRRFVLRCALWRDERQLRQSPSQRIAELLTGAGVELLEHDLQLAVASGRKARIDADIRLPFAELRGRLRITDHQRAARAWRLGVGRGRRFGFGMLVFHD